MLESLDRGLLAEVKRAMSARAVHRRDSAALSANGGPHRLHVPAADIASLDLELHRACVVPAPMSSLASGDRQTKSLIAVNAISAPRVSRAGRRAASEHAAALDLFRLSGRWAVRAVRGRAKHRLTGSKNGRGQSLCAAALLLVSRDARAHR